jgi:hypothetical protein
MAGEPMLRQGSDAEDWVQYLQEMLVEYGYDVGEHGIDGKFGPDTDAAVRLFQENNVDAYGRDLLVDGIVGPRTWSCITQSGEIEGEERPQEAGGDTESQTETAGAGETQEDRDDDTGAQTETSTTGEGQRYDYDEPVNLVMQDTDNTCWAACCAMLLSTTEQDVIEQVGDAGGDGADEPEMNVIASSLGLNMPGGRCQGPDGWHQMMTTSGPIMVGIPRHYIVLAGIQSDGDFENTSFHVYDPAQGESWMDFNTVNSAYEIDADAGANLLTR